MLYLVQSDLMSQVFLAVHGPLQQFGPCGCTGTFIADVVDVIPSALGCSSFLVQLFLSVNLPLRLAALACSALTE